MMKRLSVIFRTAVLALVLCTGTAYAQTAEQQSRRERLEREIAILDGQIKENASKSASALSRLNLVQSRVKARQKLISESDREIATINSRISEKQLQIDKVQQRLDTMTVYYSRLVKNAYKNRDARKWYMYILASENLGQASRRYGYLRDLSSQMNVQAGRIKETKAALEDQKAELTKMRADAQRLRSQRVLELDNLRKEESQVKSLTSSLNREKNKYQKELTQKKKQAQALEAEIRKAINAAVSGTSAGKTSKPIDYTLGEEFASNKGKLPWPAEGALVASFGKQYHAVFKSLQLPDNNGLSLAVQADAQVKAVFNGTVSQIAIFPGYHQCILVQHGNYFTLYSKMKTVNVKAGDKVSTGQVLGTVDTINGETVFHFEIWNEKAVPQNPENWLRPR